MDDSTHSNIFNTLIERSIVLESLKDTLDQMVDGFYIRKEASDKILKEASKQFAMVLYGSKFLLPKFYVFGQLAQYNYFNQTWVFNIKNPLMFQCLDPGNIQGINQNSSDPFDTDVADDYTPRARSSLTKDLPKMLDSMVSERYCFNGYLKIIATEDI
ncbi:hypothetical protein TpMuguga_04g02110 [Theileria parva strain Muguga]|uniref:uncharacterized protein n=1 Tax=Theileria parva strain Muguga TaxID=333668 RepID=UPI001C622D30|nr:uncharacterized protein TpMuguga_04g02110 [Theileria parva strain Muguga]KAF5153301.1 hypothetical protein TpMuguga_04g02110 [Theileria parva strain Muguga]